MLSSRCVCRGDAPTVRPLSVDPPDLVLADSYLSALYTTLALCGGRRCQCLAHPCPFSFETHQPCTSPRVIFI